MEPEQMQDQLSTDISPDEAAASLAFVTQLSEGMMTPQEIPEGEPMEGMEMEEETEEDIDAKIEDKVSKAVKEELADFRKEIKALLEDDE